MRERELGASLWTVHPGVKEKLAAQKSAVALLDALAPERPVLRSVRPPARVERFRTPDGCVLQAAHAAISVSWFPLPADDAPLGELRVCVWEGVVVRRGSMSGRRGAKVIDELRLRPLDPPLGARVWADAEGDTYDTAGLAKLCLALLERQIQRSEENGPSQEYAPA